ncbi:AraC family transcriptional regulator [Aquimarina sp. AD10]|uniref:AraC family transcriptional regulator n=1 Tax=Aquimarina sp. AD10 TaxID=1714849 RepID=UPI000E4CB987|nr:AraC family transcriptional regulator [Aquimarina sp. AD10]AXT61894.1 AraC family transcriptional regulator [Aquimarina sp. AD10]RKN02354.1 helix-turn-helix domain-containing protein [Aquimarina sp. AD10]
MPRYTLLFYLLFLFGIQSTSYSQEITSSDLDSLVGLNFKVLHDKFYENIKTNKSNAELYVRAYLQKGKNLDSVFETSKGFFYTSKLFMDNHEKRIIYLDSALDMVKNTWRIQQTVFLHNYKGTIAQTNGNYDKALDYYLEGLAYAKKENILPFISVLQSNIATLKRKLGKYEEAKLLFKKCLGYRKERIGEKPNDSIPYLLTISNLITTCRQNKEIDSASYYHNLGIEMSKGTDIQGLFRLNEGIFYYYNKEYNNAIITINTGLDEFLKSKLKIECGYHNLIDAYYFLGKSYNALSKKEKGLTYFKKIDSIVQQSHNLISESRPAYLEIIKYYKTLKDKNNQLYYINRLLHNDSIFNSKHKSLSVKLVKEYDTPLLLIQKEELITELKTKNDRSNYSLIFSLVIILIITTILFISYKKNRLYRKRFDELMSSTEKKVTGEKAENEIMKKSSSIGIAEDVVNVILKGLDDFEKTNGFLEINITSNILAKNLDTNSKYLTKVIKYHRNKSFSPYINDLRIEYIIQQLKKDTKLQKYTIKALASEAGFNSTEVFSKSFFKKTGIYPSYFVKRIQTQ